MRRFSMAILLFAFAGWAGAAQGFDLSGSWASQLTFSGGTLLPESSLTLDLRAPSWELETSWSLSGGKLTGQTIEISTTLGALGLTAGAAFSLEEGELGIGGSELLLEDIKIERAYLELSLSLGDFLLKLALVGSPDPGK